MGERKVGFIEKRGSNHPPCAWFGDVTGNVLHLTSYRLNAILNEVWVSPKSKTYGFHYKEVKMTLRITLWVLSRVKINQNGFQTHQEI